MTYDAKDGYALMFGGSNPGGWLGDTWAFGNGTWKPIAAAGSVPQAQYGQAMAYDSQSGTVVMVQSIASPTPPSAKTWTYSAGNWSGAAAPSALAPRTYESMADDPALGEVVLYSGQTGSWPADTWAYRNQTWTEPISNSPPGALVGQMMCYDPEVGAIVMFGGFESSSGNPASDETWVYLPIDPLQAVINASSLSGPTPLTVQFSANVTGGIGPYNYSWTFGDGSANYTEGPVHQYTTAGTYSVLLVATDLEGRSSYSTTTVRADAPAPIPSIIPGTVSADANVLVAFLAQVSSGNPPISYHWDFGDSTTGAGANVTHAYASAGAYKVTLWTNDSAGLSGTANATVEVAPALVVGPITATPNPANFGQPVNFSAAVSGGTPP